MQLRWLLLLHLESSPKPDIYCRGSSQDLSWALAALSVVINTKRVVWILRPSKLSVEIRQGWKRSLNSGQPQCQLKMLMLFMTLLHAQ